MKWKSIKCTLILTVGIPIIAAYPSPQVKQPYALSIGFFTTNPRVTFKTLKLGPVVRFTYNITPSFYSRIVYANALDTNLMGYWLGLVRPKGVIRPYAELRYHELFYRKGKTHSGARINTALGTHFVGSSFIIPTIEVDNIDNKKKIAIQPKVHFSCTKHFGVHLSYFYEFAKKNSSMQIRLTYNFSEIVIPDS